MEPIQINNQSLNFKIDSATDCNVILYPHFLTLKIPSESLEKSKRKAVNYENNQVEVIGSIQIKSMINITYTVVEVDDVPLLGRAMAKRLGIIMWNKIPLNVHTVSIDKERIISDNTDLFQGGIGKIPVEYKIEVRAGAEPVVRHTHRVPISIRGKLKERLDLLENKGIIARVEQPTEWVSNIVVAEKPDGDIRVCLNPAELNKVLKDDSHPIPTIESLLLKLQGKKIFSVVDCRDAFHQVPLEPACSFLTTFISPFGKYRYLRLPYGLAVSPEAYQ